jgi:uncharacterized membrane protein
VFAFDSTGGVEFLADRVMLVNTHRRWRANGLQLFLVSIGVALGMLLPRVHAGATVDTSRAVDVLGVVGFGILGLVSVIYSLLFLVVQSSNTTFTPRLNLFQDNPWIWRTYAAALGLFAFSMSAFLTIGGAKHVTVAVPIFAFVAALVVIVLVRNIQAKAFSSLQITSTLDSLQRTGRRTIDALYMNKLSSQSLPTASLRTPDRRREVTWTEPQTTLQQLDLHRLLATIDEMEVAVRFRVRVGQVLWEGTPVADVYGDLPDNVVLGALVVGINRTFDQDPLLAFRLLSDIGLRALSPAVNDPATAVQALDGIIGLLMALATRDLRVPEVRSASGRSSIELDMPDWEDFLSEGLDELLYASMRSPMVLARAVLALGRLEELTPSGRKSEVRSRLQYVQQGQSVPNTS